jgi:glycosyltransferase involved in cell wall biosynthesis
VPLSTDVGAVGELITDGADGLLVAPGSEGAIVEAFVAQLARLAAERGELGRLSVGAAKRAGQLNWSRSAEPLLELMQEWFPNRLALPRLRRPRVIRIQSQAAAGKTEAV